MRIYGQTLSEIFTVMPWQLKVIVLAGVIWVPFTLMHAVYVYIDLGKQINRPGLTNFTTTEGDRMDPSVTVGPDDQLFMVYGVSSTIPDQSAPKKVRWLMQVRVATARPPCKRWDGAGEVFPALPYVLTNPDGTTLADGTWWAETPSIVYDPGDPGREYKVFADKYFWAHNLDIAHKYNAIVYTWAHNPVRKASDDVSNWEQAHWLFSAKAGLPPEPFSSLVEHHLDELDPSLQDVEFYTRPSVILFNDVLYMTLSAFKAGADSPDRIIMISSADHAKTWHYAGTPLRQSDVSKMGPYTSLNGGSLLKKAGKLYLAAVFGSRSESGLGPFILGVADPAKGLLRQDPKTGAPLIIKSIPHSTTIENRIGGGYATFADACKGRGLITTEFSKIKTGFQMFDTLKDPVD